MSDIFKIVLFLVVLLGLGGCVGDAPKPVDPSKKVFEEEDAYILFALRAEEVRDFKSAAELFNTLYEKSHKKEYLYRSLQNYLVLDENEMVIKKIDEILDNSLKDYKLVRIKILALIGLNKLEEAKQLALKLVDVSNEVHDYLIVSETYVKLKKYDTAVKYLESAYVKNYNEKLLDKMAIVLYVNLNRKKDAIAQLETHSRLFGCSVLLCNRLIGFYSNDNNIDGLLSAYLRLYKLKSTSEIAQKIIQIYSYKKDFVNLTKFLEDSGIDDDLLLQLYINAKVYDKAAPLAYKLYEKNGDITHLGQSAIFEYEASKNKDDKKMQHNVIKKLKKVVSKEKEGIFLNYLGYILIDHDIDVKEGIKYVNEALKKEPDSIYYLDSLAWGYYKLGRCKEAKEVMDRVKELGDDGSKEVREHINTIDRCVKNKKIKGKI